MKKLSGLPLASTAPHRDGIEDRGSRVGFSGTSFIAGEVLIWHKNANGCSKDVGNYYLRCYALKPASFACEPQNYSVKRVLNDSQYDERNIDCSRKRGRKHRE